ncbi:hypothetical protein D3C86_1730670 [compost metagenome]
MAASMTSCGVLSRARMEIPCRKLSNTVAIAGACTVSGNSPLRIPRSTHARIPARVRARDRVRASVTRAFSGLGALITPRATMQPLGWPSSHCMRADWRSAVSMARRGGRRSSHRHSVTRAKVAR